MKTIELKLKDKKYPVFLGYNILKYLPGLLKEKGVYQIFIITDSNLKKIYGDTLINLLEKNKFRVFLFDIPAGEENKNLINLEKLVKSMLSSGADRYSFLIALGGGVISDLAGFIAATFMRGIRWGIIPTTLLSQVDSSIGGKVGIDLKEGKNLLGAFYFPNFVLSDFKFLENLPENELRNGLVEIIKTAVVFSSNLLKFIETKPIISPINFKNLISVIYQAIKIKTKVIKEDPYDEKGKRIFLNLGHTFGHALEQASNYKLTHAQAAALGLLIACGISKKLKILKDDLKERLENLFKKYNLFYDISQINLDLIEKAIFNDKKRKNNHLNFILPVKSGKVIVKTNIPKEIWKKSVIEIQNSGG
ncbi:MAG: 3-dehydroquinate synthase [Armatimonadetes bacterium]|nr:3-dehydroquinate synthase [Armatimonadota bacterium]